MGRWGSAGRTRGAWLLVWALACAGPAPDGQREAGEEPAAPARTADRIYLGSVVTVDPEGRVAEGVAVKDGRVLAVGDAGLVRAHRGRDTEVVDLEGAVLLPGFIDPHSHLLAHAVPLTGWANVSRPPVGQVESLDDLIGVLRAHRQTLAADDWLVAWGYDADGLEGGELTRRRLDQAFPGRPVLVIHVSSHGAVLNSRAFEAAGIGAHTPTPAGGVIVREAGSREPAGLVMETAFFAAAASLPRPDLAETLEGLQAAQLEYAAHGYTTIQDGATSLEGLAVLEQAASDGRLFLDVVALPEASGFAALLERQDLAWGGPYRGRLKLGGVKTVVDGSPQGRTAYFIDPMRVRGPGGERRWRGRPLLAQEQLDQIFRLAYARGIQTYTHANGDAAIDMVLAAHEAAGAPSGRRPVVIHSQFVRAEQLNTFARIGAVPSFFTNHAFFWGDLHVQNLGERRAHFLSPLRSATARGLRFTNHTDYAVTPLDPMFVLWSASERRSRSGAVIGPEERISTAEALRAITIDAAWQYFEEDQKGSIQPGKLADFVILDRNPLETPADELRQIRVLETIKEGESVWQAEGGPAPNGVVE